MLPKKEVCAKIQQATGPYEDLLTMVKRCRLKWYGHVYRSSGLAKTILQGTVKGGRRQGRQRKRLEDKIWEWTDLEFSKSQRAVENREKMEKTGCKVICGAPTILAVKGLMMMMMMNTLCPSRLWSKNQQRAVFERFQLHRLYKRVLFLLFFLFVLKYVRSPCGTCQTKIVKIIFCI